MNKQNKTEAKLTDTNWQFGGGRRKQVGGIKKCKLPVIKQLSHRYVMYSVENIVNNIAVTLYW